MTDSNTEPEAEAASDGDKPSTDQTSRADFLARATGVGSSVKQALTVPALAVLSALIIGGFIIAVTDVDSLKLWGDDPVEAFRSTMRGIGDAYSALFEGSLGSRRALAPKFRTECLHPAWR